jgi:hypothetical protein
MRTNETSSLKKETPVAVSTDTRAVSLINLSLGDLATLMEQAAARGALHALAEQQRAAYLTASQAARYLYGCDGKADAFWKLRDRYPLLNEKSVGVGRLRRWRRTDLDQFLADGPQIRRVQQNQKGSP